MATRHLFLDVGTHPESLVVRSKTGHCFAAPNNGILTFVDAFYDIDSVFLIDPEKNVIPSTQSHTSYGRDLYAYVAAQLVSGHDSIHAIGTPYKKPITHFLIYNPFSNTEQCVGSIEVDDAYDNLWTHIDQDYMAKTAMQHGET